MRAVQRRRLVLAAALVGAAVLLAILLHRGADTSGKPAGTTRARAHAHAAGATANHTTPSTVAANEESAESPELRRLIALGKPIYCAGHRGNEVALTFDDGPGIYTKLAIAKLRKHGIKATFFVVGRNIQLLPNAIREERVLGAVGDHTYTHPLLTSLPASQAEAEIVRTQQALERASGGRRVFLFRPPYGAHDARIDSIARKHNLLEILWTVDSQDSLGANYARIERNVIDGMHPGSIILMHENHGQTIRAMLNIFAALARKHLRAVSVARLLTDDPPSALQLRAGGLGCGVHGFSARAGG